MSFLDRLFTRRQKGRAPSELSSRTRRRLRVACRELSMTENEVAKRLGLTAAPRLLMIDEEEGVILKPEERISIGDDET